MSWFTSSAILTVWRIYLRLLVDVSVIHVEVIPCQGLAQNEEETRPGMSDLECAAKTRISSRITKNL